MARPTAQEYRLEAIIWQSSPAIGVIDLWNDAEMNAVSEEDYALYMNDEVHPTQAGYLLWWVPKFQAYLYGLFD